VLPRQALEYQWHEAYWVVVVMGVQLLPWSLHDDAFVAMIRL
jgi:hypothetical protein